MMAVVLLVEIFHLEETHDLRTSHIQSLVDCCSFVVVGPCAAKILSEFGALHDVALVFHYLSVMEPDAPTDVEAYHRRVRKVDAHLCAAEAQAQYISTVEGHHILVVVVVPRANVEVVVPRLSNASMEEVLHVVMKVVVPPLVLKNAFVVDVPLSAEEVVHHHNSTAVVHHDATNDVVHQMIVHIVVDRGDGHVFAAVDHQDGSEAPHLILGAILVDHLGVADHCDSPNDGVHPLVEEDHFRNICDSFAFVFRCAINLERQ
mmetsp:Transcript_3489/g.13309  ORF Transcript_3489/g.13309 Transcript_3489/m.13309 type:complete len:261 (+) Transcript_3489:987-1769(+)